MTINSIYKSENGKEEIQTFYEKLLKDWYQPNEQKIIPTKYGDTFVICSGHKNAPPLVLLHGTGSNSAMWTQDVYEFSKNYRVYAIDILGECGKSSEQRPTFNDNSYSGWLVQVFHELEIKKAILIGCSLGAWIATSFTINHPDKVNKLILLATGGITQVRVSSILLIAITSLFGKWGFNKINKMVYGNLKIDKIVLDFASLVNKYFIPRTDLLPVFKDDVLKLLKIPVLFIGGDKDCFYNSTKTAERLTQLVSKSTSIILENTGHVLTSITSYIIEFIKNETN